MIVFFIFLRVVNLPNRAMPSYFKKRSPCLRDRAFNHKVFSLFGLSVDGIEPSLLVGGFVSLIPLGQLTLYDDLVTFCNLEITFGPRLISEIVCTINFEIMLGVAGILLIIRKAACTVL